MRVLTLEHDATWRAGGYVKEGLVKGREFYANNLKRNPNRVVGYYCPSPDG
jgi:hypothetical protein